LNPDMNIILKRVGPLSSPSIHYKATFGFIVPAKKVSDRFLGGPFFSTNEKLTLLPGCSVMILIVRMDTMCRVQF
jgi:hypothetical protein